MSSSDSSDSESHPYNKEKIIREVRNRPALWNRDIKEYRDRTAITELWTEVAKYVVSNWTSMSEEEKKNHGK